MNKKLNLLGVRKLNLLKEAVEDKKIINYQWVNSQLANAGYPTKNQNGNFQIGCKDPLLSIMVTYNNSNNKVINEVEIQTLKQFPFIKQQTITLKGNQLTTQNLKNAVLSIIPSSETLKEDIEEVPNQSMNNLNQFYEIKKYFEDNFKVKEDITSDDSALMWELTLTRYLIRVVIKDNVKPYYEPQFKQKGGLSKFEFDNLENLMNSLAKNLGVKDLTSQLYTDADTEQEEENGEKETPFNRNANLSKEEQSLRAQLSDEVNKILNSMNEDFDNKNINIWNLAYSKCKNDKEKEALIKLFMNKKMNIKSEYIDRNMLGLEKWIDDRGFDIKKNLALRFIDIYSSLYPNDEIPTGSLMVLIDLLNRKLIREENVQSNFLFDKSSILYVKNIYNNLNENYKNLVDIFKMYEKVYNSNPLTPQKQQILLDNFKFLNPQIVKSPSDLAYAMCIDNDRLRDMNTIETLFSVITDKTRNDIQDEVEEQSSVKDVVKDLQRDNKLDTLPFIDKRTARLVQDAINTALAKNRQARIDFENELKNSVGK